MSKNWSERNPHGRRVQIAGKQRVHTLEKEIRNACVNYEGGLDESLGPERRKVAVAEYKEELIEEMLAMLEDPELYANAMDSESDVTKQAALSLAVTNAIDEDNREEALDWLKAQYDALGK